MIALDTSVVVPALVSWHEAHDPARRAAAGAAVPAHVRLEAYSVLTRLPAPHRLGADVAGSLLEAWFPKDRVLLPSARLSRQLLTRLVDAAIIGGASYDALVGLTAAEHRMTLATRDARAQRTYERLGVPHRLIGA